MSSINLFLLNIIIYERNDVINFSVAIEYYNPCDNICGILKFTLINYNYFEVIVMFKL